MTDDREGFYVDPAGLALPMYIVPGHGFLVLRDLHCDHLHLDGFDVGNPKAAPHPHFRGGFRGYFNVPPGPHLVVAELAGRRSEWRTDLAPGDAHVRRVDWDHGGLVPDDAQTEQNYRDLARSGSMLQAGALRPWPLASLFFEDAPEHVSIDDRPVPASAPRRFFGVTGLAPGEHRLRVGDLEATFTLPVDCRALLSCANGQLDAQDPRLATPMIRLGMLRAPRAALLTVADLAPPHHDHALADDLAALQAALGEKTANTRFGDGELALLRGRFAALQRDFAGPTLTAYVEVLRRCYVIDREMAAQSEFFAAYAAEVLREVVALPRLTQTHAMTYLRYLAEDLQDTGVPALGQLGQRLGAALR